MNNPNANANVNVNVNVNVNPNASINFAEEFSSKIPALTLLTTLGYEFIPPSQCNAMRSSKLLANQANNNKATNQVVLLCVSS